MDFLTLDFETAYSDDYTLSKMTTEAYVRDARFEVILCSVKINDGPAFWVFEDRLRHFLANEVDAANTACIAHHAHFDGLILSHHFDFRPAFWVDTLSMARVLRGAKAGNSLHVLCIAEGLIQKGDYVTYAKGKRKADFTGAEFQEYGKYSCNDGDRTYELAQRYLPKLPGEELRLIDMTVRAFTEPVFVGDIPMLTEAVKVEKQRRIDLLTRCNAICPKCNGAGSMSKDLLGAAVPCKECDGTGLHKKMFTSNDKFAALLRRFGVEPETKTSPSNGKQIYAFAKTDPALQELQEHEDADVRDLAETRIACKSNIIESRAQRFISCASRGPMPVYMSHAGAHTLRVSGGDSMNWLNMSSANENRPEMGVLKASVQAPPGYRVIRADSGQGEARILAWLANQHDLTEAFAQGRDIYSEYASGIYGRVVDRKRVLEDFIPGQLGKISILQLGFGAGYYTVALGLLKGLLGNKPIQLTVEHMQAMQIDPSRFLNNPKKVQMVSEMPTRLELNDMLIHCIVAEALVLRYRAKYQAIAGKTGFWQTCETAINAMIKGEEFVFGAHGVFRTAKDRVYTPMGLWLDYRDIQRNEEGDATYFNGRGRTKIYGSLFGENLDQHLHRTIVGHQALEIHARYPVKLWPYDEVVAVAPEAEAQQALDFMIETMARTPDWATGLPLTAEGGIGKTYAESDQ